MIFTDVSLGQGRQSACSERQTPSSSSSPKRDGTGSVLGPVGLLSADPLSGNYFHLIDKSVCEAEQCSGVSWFNASGEAKSWSHKVELHTGR